ncbi:MAG TPA: hypothetical protein VLK85_20640 [Ramlibacter sp.]|nr:hypothetical protein [Ramlibacter sp.]
MRPEPHIAGSAGTLPSLLSKDALQAWKDADNAACDAERCLYAAWYAYRSSGCSVPALLQHRATTTRALARQRLNEAIAARKSAAHQGT